MSIEKIRPNSREEWLKLRTEGLGSSEFAAAIGLNPYCTRWQLWRRKTAERNGEIRDEQNEAMLMGTLFEDAVARRWEIATGKKFIKASEGDWIVRNDERPYLQASPDRIYYIDEDGKHNEENKGILECKTTNLNLENPSENLVTIKDSEGVEHYIPMSWYCQVQYQMYCYQKSEGTIAVYNLMKRVFDHVSFGLDNAFMEEALKECDDFWSRCVIGGEEPQIDTSEDALEKYPSSSDLEKSVGDDVYGRFMQYLRNKKVYNELGNDIKADEEYFKSTCTDAERYKYGDTLLWTFKSVKGRKTFNTERLEIEHPDIYQRYVEQSDPTRRFVANKDIATE